MINAPSGYSHQLCNFLDPSYQEILQFSRPLTTIIETPSSCCDRETSTLLRDGWNTSIFCSNELVFFGSSKRSRLSRLSKQSRGQHVLSCQFPALYSLRWLDNRSSTCACSSRDEWLNQSPYSKTKNFLRSGQRKSTTASGQSIVDCACS